MSLLSELETEEVLCPQPQKRNETGASAIQNEPESIAERNITEIPNTTHGTNGNGDGATEKWSTPKGENGPRESTNLSERPDAPTASGTILSDTTSTISNPNDGTSQKCATQPTQDSNQNLQDASCSARPAIASDIGKILDQIVAFLKRYVVFPIEEQFAVTALWVAHTFVYDQFHWSAYLVIKSPERECGKTTVLSCIKLLCRAPWNVAVPTPAVLYRKIEAHRPTVLLDEYDTIYSKAALGEANETLRGILNVGFEKGAVIPRCDGHGHALAEFSPYCPKALAGIGRLPDTVESRSLHLKMARAKADDKIEEYDDEVAPAEAAPIYLALEAWAKTVPDLHLAKPDRPQILSARQRNITKPLFAIAELAGPEWMERAKRAIVKVCAKEKLATHGTQLLSDIRDIFLTTGNDKMFTESLLELLIKVENAHSPWARMWEADLGRKNVHGPASKLAQLLGQFGIESRTLRIGDQKKRGYYFSDFNEVWERYLEPAKDIEPETMDLF